MCGLSTPGKNEIDTGLEKAVYYSNIVVHTESVRDAYEQIDYYESLYKREYL